MMKIRHISLPNNTWKLEKIGKYERGISSS